MNSPNASELTDDEFVRAFESCTLPVEAFRHREHLRLAWLYLRRFPCETAMSTMARSIRRYASHHGVLQKYHHTITLVWMRLVAAAAAKDSGKNFDAFLEANPQLLDKAAPRRYYSVSRLDSQAARAEWLEPDLSRLP